MRRWLLGVLLALLLGGVLRLACLNAEFWLDEIWSWQLAHEAGSPLGVFTVKHDNNHHLNTAWLSLWPAEMHWTWYRLHAVLAGLVSIVLAARIGRRFGQADAVYATVLVAGCSWLVLTSVEARGYALAVCFALLAFDVLWSYLDHQSWPALVAFWLFSILGFLSHLTFVHAYLGFLVWSHRRIASQCTSSLDEMRRLLVCHGVVAAFFVPFYLLCIRGMEIGGGPPVSAATVLARLVSVGLGGPAQSWWMLPGVAAAVLLFACGLWLLHREGQDVWLFFAVTCAAAPALFLIRAPEYLAERYFFIPFVFFLLLVAHVLAAAHRTRHRVVAGALLLAFLAGNLWHVWVYFESGRGQFRQALAWVAEHDDTAEIIVTGDNDFRVRKYVEFYAPRLSDARPVIYRDKDALAQHGAEWLFVHRLDDHHPIFEEMKGPEGQVYRLVRSFPSQGPVAWGWFVYRRHR